MTNIEHTEQQTLLLTCAIVDEELKSLINRVRYAIGESKSPEWKEQLETVLPLLENARLVMLEAWEPINTPCSDCTTLDNFAMKAWSRIKNYWQRVHAKKRKSIDEIMHHI
jgi:hypothetical protein